MRHTFLYILIAGLLACSNRSEKAAEQVTNETTVPLPVKESESKPLDTIHEVSQIPDEKKSSIPPTSIRFNVFKNTEVKGYGYDILMGDKLYIHQPNVPALPGNDGFETEEDAQRVAELVIFKIKNNIVPPTIDVKELDSLGIKLRWPS